MDGWVGRKIDRCMMMMMIDCGQLNTTGRRIVSNGETDG